MLAYSLFCGGAQDEGSVEEGMLGYNGDGSRSAAASLDQG